MSKTMQGAFYEFLFLNLPAAHCCRHCQLLAHPSGQQNPFHITEVEKVGSRDFLGGPVATYLLCNAGDMGSIHGRRTKILHATEQLSLQSSIESPCTETEDPPAAAKSLQSCLTLDDPIDGSPPGSPPWDSPGKSTGVGCHCLLRKIPQEVAKIPSATTKT